MLHSNGTLGSALLPFSEFSYGFFRRVDGEDWMGEKKGMVDFALMYEFCMRFWRIG